MLMKMLSFLLLSSAITATAIITPVASQPQTSRTARYMKYKGAWFDIDYPIGWKVMSYGRSASSTRGSDSVRFTSPDGSAEFYVFSPQWNGNPKEIALDPIREEVVFHHVEHASRGKMTGDSYISKTAANWYTVRAKDHSYERSWVDVEDKNLNVRHVFGIKYRNGQIYRKYQAQYAHFRKSLEQFSD